MHTIYIHIECILIIKSIDTLSLKNSFTKKRHFEYYENWKKGNFKALNTKLVKPELKKTLVLVKTRV